MLDLHDRIRHEQTRSSVRHETAEHKKDDEEPSRSLEPRENHVLSDEKVEELRKNVIDIINSDEVYSPDFNALRLATLCNTNTRYLSSVLADMKEGGFPAIVAEARVREAMRRLASVDSEFENFTLEAVGESVGFKSMSSFYTSFKRVTGLTPREYRRISREKDS